jgi:hypothetical protein
MEAPTDDPPEGFTRISGKRSPPRDGAKYHVQFRNGFIDWRTAYSAEQLVWKHDGSSWDVVAVQHV